MNNEHIIDLGSDVLDFNDLETLQILELERPNIPLPRYNSSELTYHIFVCEHMIKNLPCIIYSIMDKWPGLKWVADNKPDFKYLTQMYGHESVPVANCEEKYYNSQKKEDQLLMHYLDYWETYISKNYHSLLDCLYLKDWHFTRDFPEDNIYTVPSFFASDWLNEYFTVRKDIKDDYRFVYMGPKGSWTPLHADVFSSFSWSVNLCGKKRWILFPPGQEKYLKDKQDNLIYDIEALDVRDTGQEQYDSILKGSVEIIQQPGEAIFVPSGWHHQVWNLDDTISINHNWINGYNVKNMWMSLQENLAAVQAEIADCKDMDNWEEHCQVMLSATYGLDYKLFCQFLLYIVSTRLQHLRKNSPLKVYGGWLIGQNHLKFDLIQAKAILLELTSNCDFNKLPYYFEVEYDIKSKLEEINTIVDKK